MEEDRLRLLTVLLSKELFDLNSDLKRESLESFFEVVEAIPDSVEQELRSQYDEQALCTKLLSSFGESSNSKV